MPQLIGAAWLAAVSFTGAGCEQSPEVVEVSAEAAARETPADQNTYEVTSLPQLSEPEKLRQRLYVAGGIGVLGVVAAAGTCIAIRRHAARQTRPLQER